MIVVTVGAQMPFDRLVRCVDTWAASRGRDDVFAQIAVTDWRPSHIRWTPFLDPSECRRYLFEADVIIAHAGMGTILTALEFCKPILVMPRRGDLKETRNDHQFGTARAFAEADRVTVAWNEQELLESLDHLDSIPAPKQIASHASLELLATLRGFIRPDKALPVAAPTVGMIHAGHAATLPSQDETRKAA